MNPAAYLLMCLDVGASPPHIVGIDIFSEESPTTAVSKRRWFTILVGYGDDYEAGIADLRSRFAPLPNGYDHYGWCVPFMGVKLAARMGR